MFANVNVDYLPYVGRSVCVCVFVACNLYVELRSTGWGDCEPLITPDNRHDI